MTSCYAAIGVALIALAVVGCGPADAPGPPPSSGPAPTPVGTRTPPDPTPTPTEGSPVPIDSATVQVFMMRAVNLGELTIAYTALSDDGAATFAISAEHHFTLRKGETTTIDGVTLTLEQAGGTSATLRYSPVQITSGETTQHLMTVGEQLQTPDGGMLRLVSVESHRATIVYTPAGGEPGREITLKPGSNEHLFGPIEVALQTANPGESASLLITTIG